MYRKEINLPDSPNIAENNPTNAAYATAFSEMIAESPGNDAKSEVLAKVEITHSKTAQVKLIKTIQ